jgi:hypothetical protein
MPATVAAPTSGGHETVSGKPPSHLRVASQLAAVIPSSLPPTRPTTIPCVIGEETALATTSPLISTPALARANSGTTTKLVHGWNRYCSRSLGETATVTPMLASRAYWGVGCSRNMRHRAPARCRSSREGEAAVASRPTATPAIVGCTPDASIDSHSPSPTMK